MADKKMSQLTGASTPLAGTELVPVVQSGETKSVSVNNLTAGKAVSAAQVNVDNIRLDGNDITTTDTNGNLGLNPNGTGLVTSNNRFRSVRSDGIGFQALNTGDFYYGYLRNDGFDAYTNTNGSAPLNLRSGGSIRVSIDTVGNATVNSGNLVIGTSGKGIDFSATSNATGMTSELLADYEEGTWTPVFAGADGPLDAVTYTTQSGTYTKIGDRVFVRGAIATSAVTVGGATGMYLVISGLPFTAPSALDGFCVHESSGFATNTPTSGRVRGATQVFLLYRTAANSQSIILLTDAMGTGAGGNVVNFSFFYKV